MLDGTHFLIKTIKPLLGDIVLEGKGGIELSIDTREFYNKIADGAIQLPQHEVQAAQRAWSASESAAADFRLALLEFAQQLDVQGLEGAVRQERLEVFCQSHRRKRPCDKTIKAYKQRYQQFGYEGLIPNFSQRGGAGWRSKKVAKEIARNALIEYFMEDDKINLTSMKDIVDELLKQHNEIHGVSESIDRKTISRILLKLPKSLVKGGRLDPRTYALWNRQAVECYQVQLPFELVEVDAKTIDLYSRDESGVVHTQLTLYAMVCARTSYPIGVYVTAGKPSQYALLKVFEFFFTPKDEVFNSRFGIKTDWVSPCGITGITYDNGPETSADLALSLVRKMGISTDYARIGRGDDKPHVESFFKVLDERLLNKMPGAQKSQDTRVKSRHARAEQEACYSVDKIYQEIVQFIADVYIHEPCADLGFLHGKRMSIKQAMDEDLKRFMPLPAPSLQRVQNLILDVYRDNRKLQYYGVDFEGFRFYCAEFAQLARDREIQRVDIRFNPEDCTAIYFVHPDNQSLIRADNKMVGIPAVSFDVAKQLKKAYTGDPEQMTGHDYQREYARTLMRYAADSRKRPKIRDNNKKLREQERLRQKADIAEQLDKLSPPVFSAHPLAADDDDDFTPAPRVDLSNDPN
ncbi:transposase [Pseudomonas taiwanensis]|uniref:Mu transposase C-terminal domain-containing protein n=1 Tax=Pseudomonas taiwanensis TaxID=470150 RepID=UPI0015BF4B22|nr:Mu transposase C-terminal domain-containing protein [Pseudomonas taiwanensis]NWL79569.1 transposase [Pseudomonas taiwanensis]